MSGAFYERFLNVFKDFFLLVFMALCAMILMLMYVSTGNYVLYFGGYVILAIVLVYFIYFMQRLKDFKEKLAWFLPKSEEKSPTDAMPIDLSDDQCIQICTMYRNGLGYTAIMNTLNLKHHNAVKRGLLKGLDLLLKEHYKGETK